jgi:solute carrier family 10 (sodium/bile acid cotransporter), member 7
MAPSPGAFLFSAYPLLTADPMCMRSSVVGQDDTLANNTPIAHSKAPSVAEQPTKPFIQRAWDKLLWLVLDQWFLIAIGVLIIIASQVQVPQSQQKVKETAVNYLCPTLIFLVTGATLPTRVLLANYARWKLHLFVQGFCFLVDSAIVFGIVSAIASNRTFFDPGLLVGMIFMSCSPTTISSNVVMTRAAHGSDSVTVVESSLGNVLAPFFTPLLVRMYLSSGAWYTDVVPMGSMNFGPLYRRVFKQLGLSMIVPLVVGQLIQNVFPTQTKHITTKYKLAKVGSLALLVIIWSTYDKAFFTGAITTVADANMIVLVFLSIGLYVLWLALSISLSRLWLNKRDTIAVAYCIPAKTPAMGVPLAGAMFATLDAETAAKLQIPLVIFQGLQIAGGSLSTIPFRRWVRDEEEATKREAEEQAQLVREKAAQ